MDELTPQPRPVAERVRTVLARGAAGSIGTGLLTRPLRSARVRDDGVVVLVVDVSGVSREVDDATLEASDATPGSGDAVQVAEAGASATIEILDTVCTGRCRDVSPGPSFALDGRPSARERECDGECAVARGIVTITGIVTASSGTRRRRLVAAGGSATDSGGGGGALRMSELQPLQISYVTADGVHLVRRAELAAAAVDPIGVDEPTWLRRLSRDTGFAARLALRAGLQIAGTHPRIVGLDRSGIELAVNASGAAFPEVVRLPFARTCRDADDVQRELSDLLR